MNDLELVGWVALIWAMTIAGALLIRILARSLEHRLLHDVARQVAIYGHAMISVDRTLSRQKREEIKLRVLDAARVYPHRSASDQQHGLIEVRASLWRFGLWLSVVFLAGVLTGVLIALLAQRVAVGAELTTHAPGSAVASSALEVPYAPRSVKAAERPREEVAPGSKHVGRGVERKGPRPARPGV